MKDRTNIKALLIQFRKDEQTRTREHDQFVRFAGIEKEQCTSIDVFNTPIFDKTILDQYDMLFMGGTSDDPKEATGVIVKYDKERYPYIESMQDILSYAKEQGIPTLISCFGFQVAIDLFDGRMVVDNETMEDGSAYIHLTSEGQVDPVFKDIPNPFSAVTFHSKLADKLPPDAILLAHAEKCPIHIFKIKNKPFYAFQFHPEIDYEDIVERLAWYKDKYPNLKKDLQGITDRIMKTPDTHKIIKNFVDHVVLKSKF